MIKYFGETLDSAPVFLHNSNRVQGASQNGKLPIKRGLLKVVANERKEPKAGGGDKMSVLQNEGCFAQVP